MFSSTRSMKSGSVLARLRISGSTAVGTASARCVGAAPSACPVPISSAASALPAVATPRSVAAKGVSTTPACCSLLCVRADSASPTGVTLSGGRRSPRSAASSCSCPASACLRAASSLSSCCCAKLSVKASPRVGVAILCRFDRSAQQQGAAHRCPLPVHVSQKLQSALQSSAAGAGQARADTPAR